MPFEHIEQRNVPVIVSFQTFCHAKGQKQFWYALSVLCSLGSTWVLARRIYTVALRLKLQPCSPKNACFILAKLSTGNSVFCPVESSNRRPSTGWLPCSVRQTPRKSPAFLLVRIHGDAYAYSGDTNTFTRVPRMPPDLPEQLESALLQLHVIDQEGGSWEAFNPITSWPRTQRALMYGHNQVPVRPPSRIHAIRILLQSPLILAQGALTALWMWAYTYWRYPAMLFGILLAGSGASSYLLYGQRLRLVSMATQRHLVPLLHKKFVRALLAKQLVPGDVIVVQRGKVVCDMVLLRGTCLVEESMLSGEASQMRKVSHNVGVRYDPDVHRSSTLHAASIIEQVWVDDDEQAESLAMVVRTGEYTTTGAMLRPLIHTQKDASSVSLGDEQTKDRGKFLGCSLAVNMLMFITCIVMHDIVQYRLAWRPTLHQLLRFVLNALPPLLASLLVMLRFVTVLRLRHQNIFLSDTRKLQTAAQLDLVLFDKTGTLTVGEGHLHGVVVCEDGILAPGLKTEAITWSYAIREALALCNDLMPLNGRQIVGPDSEKRAFADVEAAFVGRNAVCLPTNHRSQDQASFVTLQVLHRLEFDAEFLMSGVVVQTASAKQEEPQIFLKGSVHSVVQLVAHNRLPGDWAHVMMTWNAMGYRTMGVVSGKVVVEHRQDITKITLANVNNHVREMSLLGILVFKNPLRSDSVAAVAELQNMGRLKTMMVTGDHSMTGIAVSQQIGMLSKTQPIVVFDKEAPKKGPNSVARPTSTELPQSPRALKSPSAAPKAATFAASPGNLPQKSTAPQRSFAQAQSRAAGSSLSTSRASSSVTHIEATDAAAFRASLRKAKFAVAEPTSDSTSRLGSEPETSAPASDLLPYPLHAPSQSCRPLLEGSATSSASTPEAVALAASSSLFKSSSLLAPSSAGSSAASSGAARAAAKAPSPLLASYLKSMDGAKQSSTLPTSSVQNQPVSAEQRSQAQPPDEPPSHAQAESPLSPKLSRFSKVSFNSSAFSKGASSTWSNQLYSPQCEENEGVRLSTDSMQPESCSDSQTQLLPRSPVTQPPEFEPQSESQLQSQAQTMKTQSMKTQTQKTQTQTSTSDANQLLRSCLKSSLQVQSAGGQEVTNAESEFRKKTSVDLRQWAVEQSRKQQSFSPQGLGLALSGLRRSLEMQSGHRNRSLDLVRADVKNMRLSFDSANLPRDEKLRCIVVDLAASSVRMISSKEAFDTVAAGSPCVITGFAFEYMVKEVEAAQVELAVRNAVLCARMKAHQKSQLVRLLSKGLQVPDYHTLKGLGHTVAYCGDGINDIAALHAADLGVAIGATQAMVAAPVFTPAESATVVCTLIREARCSIMISYSLFKYMVLYGFIQSVVGCVAFFVAHTNLSIPQYECMDNTALCLSLAALCTRPARQLTARGPSRKLMSLPVLAPLLLFMVCYSLQQAMAWHFNRTQAFYQRSYVKDAAVATSMLVALFQLLLPAFAFFNDMRPHCMGFRHNPAVPAVVFGNTVFWGLVMIIGKGVMAKLLWLDSIPNAQRLKLIAFAVLTFGGIKVLLIFTRWRVSRYSASKARHGLRG